MYKYTDRAREMARNIIEMKALNIHVGSYYYEQLAVEIYKENEELMCDALSKDNKNYASFVKNFLMFVEPGNMNFKHNELVNAFCGHARLAIEELLELIEDEDSPQEGDWEVLLDRADYERQRG